MLRRVVALVLSAAVGGLLLLQRGDGLSTAQTATGQAETTEVALNLQKKQRAGLRAAARTARAGRAAEPNAEYLGRLIAAAEEGDAAVLSTGDSCDDFASVAQASDGTVYVAYAAYYDGHDQIRMHRQLDQGNWSTRSNVPLAEAHADIWMPQLAVDALDHVWVVWSEQTARTRTESGNWDLYARQRIGDAWGPLVRLCDNAKPDINPHVFTDGKHNIHVVWQAHPENNGDIHYCRYDGTGWSQPLAVTSDAESDWYPRGAVDEQGTVWIAFDSYRNGDYDVFLTSIRDGVPGKVIPIATSSYYEAHASVACTPDGRVWVAWEQGGHNWGKNQGYWLRRASAEQGTTLGSTRSVKVACYHDGRILAAPDLAQSIGDDGRDMPTAMAELATGSDGRLWLRYRHMVRRGEGPRANPRNFPKGWTENVAHLTASGWSQAVTLPASHGRISVFSRMLPANDGSLYVAYSSDARVPEFFHRPIQDTVLVAHLDKPDDAPGVGTLSEYTPPDPPAIVSRWNAALEAKQVAAIREKRVEYGGQTLQIVRGDLHRHTELSWDVGPGNDGSYLDFYRYMIDVAAMDFGGLTDHQGGGHYAYWWWLTQKSADMYYLAPRFVPLYGYERSVRFPNGHRNVFHAYRGVPIFPFQLKLDQKGVFPGTGTAEVVSNDTKLLYEYLHKTGGIAISHTSGTSAMGTDWRDNDPAIEPVVEIYQGARNNYETLGAPRVHGENEKPDDAPGGFQKEGLVWNAYKKGYRLGTITSSDHGSTHISYALVYVTENKREAILDGIRKRRTYGATDNILVDFRANDRLMGEEFSTGDRRRLTLNVTGTSRIAQIDLVRNNEYVYSSKPDKETLEVEYIDSDPAGDVNLYYFRVLQADGEVAWCSPIWIGERK